MIQYGYNGGWRKSHPLVDPREIEQQIVSSVGHSEEIKINIAAKHFHIKLKNYLFGIAKGRVSVLITSLDYPTHFYCQLDKGGSTEKDFGFTQNTKNYWVTVMLEDFIGDCRFRFCDLDALKDKNKKAFI